MNPEQERAGWEITHQGWDRACWLAAFGDQDDLKPFVADPARFIDRRSETAVVMSDQVPFWVKIGNRKVVCSAADKGERSNPTLEKTGAAVNAQHSQAMSSVDALGNAMADQKQTQTRGPQKSGYDKVQSDDRVAASSSRAVRRRGSTGSISLSCVHRARSSL